LHESGFSGTECTLQLVRQKSSKVAKKFSLKKSFHESFEMQSTGWKMLSSPSIQTILIVGCGGGFDFVHSLLFYNELIALGKKIVVGSYSFGDPRDISGEEAEHVFGEGKSSVFKVTSKCSGSPSYCPEIGFCSILDEIQPQFSPHYIYAYNARAFTVSALSAFYSKLVADHNVDAIIVVDGGSDSLMRGDENELGDPVEDAVSVRAVASLCCSLSAFQDSHLNSSTSCHKILGILMAIGVGCDRFNFVSDASSFRAIAEITSLGGFLGATSIERSSDGLNMYREGLNRIYELQSMRSVLAGSIVSSAMGCYGSEGSLPPLPIDFGSRLSGELYLWPIMSLIWMFDVTVVSQRSYLCDWVESAEDQSMAQRIINRERKKLSGGVRPVENFPLARTISSMVYENELPAVGTARPVHARSVPHEEEEGGKKCQVS
jgi:hypothetical protein